MEGVRFANMGNLTLDARWKSTIHLLVLHNAVVIVHLEIFKVSLGLTFRIVGSEVIF